MSLVIKEIKSNHYKVEPIAMANDQIIKDVEAPLPSNYGFFLLLVGRPNSGKSTLWLNLINKKAKNTYYNKFDKVFIFSASLSTITTKIKLNEERMFNGIEQLESVVNKIKETPEEKNLIIIDDLITDFKDEDYILKLVYNRRHLAIGGSVSLIVTSQVFTKVQLCIRKCATTLILFNTGSKKELESIYQDFVNIDNNTFYGLVRHCFKNSSHDFILMDNTNGLYYHNFNLLQFD